MSEGWAWPMDAGQVHYFMNAVSLCGAWHYLSTDLAPDFAVTTAECHVCRHKLNRLTRVAPQ